MHRINQLAVLARGSLSTCQRRLAPLPGFSRRRLAEVAELLWRTHLVLVRRLVLRVVRQRPTSSLWREYRRCQIPIVLVEIEQAARALIVGVSAFADLPTAVLHLVVIAGLSRLMEMLETRLTDRV